MFVPKHRPLNPSDLEKFLQFWQNHSKILVLTGAGVSTESGIPDYRSENVGLYARTNHKPMQYQEFMKSEKSRRRYWARNYLGWPNMVSLRPNMTHLGLSKLGNQVVTQNVDGLHTFSGSKDVVELHGSSHRVICMGCRDLSKRTDLQIRLRDLNQGIEAKIGAVRPDGDVDVNEKEIENFKLAECQRCGGFLKPDIVFFGDNVPSSIVHKVSGFVKNSDALLVLGSSITVFSAFRIVNQAKELGKTVFIVNIGPTRADELAHDKLDVKCSDLFAEFLKINNCVGKKL